MAWGGGDVASERKSRARAGTRNKGMDEWEGRRAAGLASESAARG